jgi:zinc protease
MRHLLKVSVIVIALIAFGSCNNKTNEVNDSKLDDNLPIDNQVRIGKLDNGLTYYIRKNKKPENRAELRLALNAGSLMENDAQQGLAHFTEHMMFNGTEHFEKNDLIDFFELSGMKFGAHVNAYTSFDETVYMLKPRTDSAEIFEASFQVLEDWAHLASFDSTEVDKERGVVIEEWRLRLGAQNRMMQEYLPVLFHDSHYAERLPIGKKDILENFEHQTLIDFYKTWYRPDLMAVIAVGDFDVDEVEQKIKDHFSNLTNPENEQERKLYDLPDHKETLVKVVKDKEATFTNIQINIKHDKKESKTVGDYKGYLKSRLYRQMLSQRFEEIKNQENPPFVYAGSGYGGLTRTKDAYSSFAMVDENNIMRGFETIVKENQRVAEHGFTESELERAKKDLLKSIESQYNDRDKMESGRVIREYLNNFLDGEPIPGIEKEYELTKELLPEIALEDINALPKKWITDENIVIIFTGPDKEGVNIPTEEEVLTAYNKVKGEPTEAYVDDFTGSELMTESPEPGKITNESENKDLGITELTFDNGAKVILKPTDFKNDEILLSAFSYGGSSLYGDEDYQTVSNIADIVMSGGIGDFSETDLQKLMSGKEVDYYPIIQDIYEGGKGSATPDDLETLLQLQYMYFTSPRKDPVSFESYKQKQKMIYQNLGASPQYFFIKEYLKILYNDHLRARIPEAEDFDKIDLDKGYEIYKERFANGGDFTFILVGNFDVGNIKPLLEKYIGGLPANGQKEMFNDIGMRYPNKKVSKDVKKGKEPQSRVTLAFSGDFDWNYKNRFTMGALSDVLKIKLRESMREDKGGVYGVGVSPQPSHLPNDDYLISISFGCAPENVNDLINTAIAEINKLKADGATETDLKKVKETLLRTRETDLKENRFWLRGLEQYYKNGDDPMTILKFEEYVNNLTSDDIKQAANQYFLENQMIRMVLYPEVEKEMN